VKGDFADYGGDKVVCCPRAEYATRLVKQELSEDLIRANAIKLRFSGEFQLPRLTS
jgi:hypothetical protein